MFELINNNTPNKRKLQVFIIFFFKIEQKYFLYFYKIMKIYKINFLLII